MPGFAKPTTTQTPDALLDYWLTRLTGSELRVLLYAVRRTYGFKRDEDAISLEQFLHGITTREGTVLDAGIGISRSALLGAIKSLTTQGLLLKARRVGDDGRDTVSIYRLALVDDRHPRPEQGLRELNTTQVPDEIFDYWLPRLSDAELKVLLYIVRRTLGFRKQADAIKPAQFLSGVTSRSGAQLDGGCGVSQKHLYRALSDLQSKGLISVQRRVSARVGNQASVFTLVFAHDVPALLRPTADLDPRALDYRLDEIPLMVVPPRDAPPHASTQDTERGQKRHRAGSEKTQSPHRGPGTGEQKGHKAGAEKIQSGVSQDTERSVSQQIPQQTDSLKERQQTEKIVIESMTSDLTILHRNGTPPRVTAATDVPPPAAADALIAARIEALVAEVGDTSSPRASVTKARRRFHDSGCAAADFLALIDDARTVVRRYRPAKPMPYFFTTLDGLVRTTATRHPDEVAAVGPLPITEPHPVWRAVLEEIQSITTVENFTLWFAATRVVAAEGDVVRVQVPTPFSKDWLERKLQGRVRDALVHCGYGHVRVEYVVASEAVRGAGFCHRRD